MKVERLDLAKPLMAQLEITSLCNHRCLHCYYLDSDINNRPIEPVQDSTVLQVADKLIEAEIFNVVVTGGEPLMKRDLAIAVTKKFKSAGIDVSINSNITLIDKEFIRFIRSNDIAILTSCPSVNPQLFSHMIGVNNYEIFESKLKSLYSEGIRVAVNMVVTRDNLSQVRQTAQRLYEIGCVSFSATPMFLNMDYPRPDLLLSKEDIPQVVEDLIWIQNRYGMNIDILESLPKCVFPRNVLYENHVFLNRKCQAGRTVIGVSPSGEVRPCSTNSISYGNVLNESITTIWNKMSEWRTDKYFPKECVECAWIDRCNSGCRINAKTLYGEWNSPEIWFNGIISKDPPKDYKAFVLEAGTLITISKAYKIRKEYDNIFVVFNTKDQSFVMVNEMIKMFIEALPEGKTSVGELASLFNTSFDNPNFKECINLLINKNLIQII